MTKEELRDAEENEDREVLMARRRDAIAIRQDYRNVFLNSPSGQRVLKDLLKKNYFFNDNLVVDMPELIGKRNAVCSIMNMLCVADNPDKTIEAIIEAMSKWPIISKEEDLTHE